VRPQPRDSSSPWNGTGAARSERMSKPLKLIRRRLVW
jgi:hypothetical protein